jgi:hypothetical protein
MAEPTAGIARAAPFGEREPPASRSNQKSRGRAKSVPPAASAQIPASADPTEADEIEKHELDTLA